MDKSRDELLDELHELVSDMNDAGLAALIATIRRANEQ